MSAYHLQSGGKYRALARVYRPTCFSQVVGQPFLVQVLRQTFETGRIYHAYLLSGGHGRGKTTTARLLARSLNYDDKPTFDIPPSAWGQHCRAILNGEHIDVLEMDAASHTSVDDIRSILESIPYKPSLARYKIFIIDEAHMLSRSAFNALLKTLEEPPDHVKFIFATTDLNKIPITVLSRCQRFKLAPIDPGELEKLCERVAAQEGYTSIPGAFQLVAFHAQGSARDALSLLDQVIMQADCTQPLSVELVQKALGLVPCGYLLNLLQALARGNVKDALALAQEQYQLGVWPHVLLQDMLELLHDLTLCQVDATHTPTATLRWGGPVEALAKALDIAQLSHMWQIVSRGVQDVQTSFKPTLACSMVFVRLAHAWQAPKLTTLIQEEKKANTLEEKVRKDPFVAGFLNSFPGATITKLESL